jgi:DNA modification methylase
MCGDSASTADVDTLLDGHSIQMCHTDPPYGVSLEPRSNNAIAAGLSSFPGQEGAGTTGKMRAKDRPLANDSLSEEEFDQKLDAWFGNIARVLEPGRAAYIWGGYANLANYPSKFKKNGLYWSQCLIWNKLHPVMNRKDFMSCYELCYYCWREGAAHKFFGQNNERDLWEVKKEPSQKTVHPTQKPVELAVRAIQLSSKPGENVLELFGGSGSTLIACEQTGRNCFAMEIDEAFCDVIVQRWEEFTGQKAKRITAKGAANE